MRKLSWSLHEGQKSGLDQAQRIIGGFISDIAGGVCVPKKAELGREFLIGVPELQGDGQVGKQVQGEANVAVREWNSTQTLAYPDELIRFLVDYGFQRGCFFGQVAMDMAAKSCVGAPFAAEGAVGGGIAKVIENRQGVVLAGTGTPLAIF